MSNKQFACYLGLNVVSDLSCLSRYLHKAALACVWIIIPQVPVIMPLGLLVGKKTVDISIHMQLVNIVGTACIVGGVRFM